MIGWESRKLPHVTNLFSLMKCVKRSSICRVAFGKRSLYIIFIMAISLSTNGERVGLDKLRDRGRRCSGEFRPVWSNSFSDVGVSEPWVPVDDIDATSVVDWAWCCGTVVCVCANWCFNSFDWCGAVAPWPWSPWPTSCWETWFPLAPEKWCDKIRSSSFVGWFGNWCNLSWLEHCDCFLFVSQRKI